MLRSLKDLERYTVSATDGDIGSVTNFLLDDERWIVRYLVVETGGFFGGRQVLISPISFRRAEWTTQAFHLALTMDKIKNSPGVDTDKPVSRQHEHDYHQYYGYPYYWAGAGLWGAWDSPALLADTPGNDGHDAPADEKGDTHLRSVNEVRGYHIQGKDGAIGHVADVVVDDETWAVRYLVVDTRNWWFGKKVLVAPNWASRVSWEKQEVFVDISRQAIKDSPPWDATSAINRAYEERLYDYYGRPVHWETHEERPVRAPAPHPVESHPESPSTP